MNPKISVAIAVYNGDMFLREQLDSIYAQTLAPFEVIAVDDCSSDNSLAILQEYSQKYGLKNIQNEQNLGANKTFEKAILLSSGDFIAPSDQDDIWAENKLEECYKAISALPMDEPNVIICQSIHIDANKKIICKNLLKNRIYKFQDFFPIYDVSGACSLFNSILKDKVLPFKISINYDAEFILFAILAGNCVYIPETWRFFRHHSGNLTSMINNSGFLGKLRFFIHNKLYINRLGNIKLNVYMEIIKKYNLNIDAEKMNFLMKLQDVTQRHYKIFSVKEFSFTKRIKIFITFYIYKFIQIFKNAIGA